MFKKIWPKTNFDFWGQICLLFCQGDPLKSQNFQVVIMSYWEKLKKLLNEIFKILIFYRCLHFVVILTSVTRHFVQKSQYFSQNILTHLVKWQLLTITLLWSDLLYMSIYCHFGLPPVTGKLQSFTAGKRSVNGKSINPIFVWKFLLKK